MQELLKHRQGYKIVKSNFGRYEQIPDDWSVSQIRGLGQIVTGNTPNTYVREYYGESVPWASPTDMGYSKYIEKTQTMLSEKGFEISRRIPKKSVLLVCIGSTIGKVGIASKEMSTNQQINSVICKEDDNEFVYYQLLFNQQIIQNMANQAALPILNKSDFGTIKIYKPNNLDEQQKIASILSNVDELIQKTDQIIEEIQRLKKALIQKLLTKGIGHTKYKKIQFYNEVISIPEEWAVTKLRDCTTKIGSGITPRGGSKVYENKGIPLIRSQNVHFDGLKLHDVAYITQDIHNEMKNTKLQDGDVLLNITGASLGRCTCVPADFGEGNVNQHVCIIRPINNLNSLFLSLFLSSYLGQKMIFRSPNGLSREGLNFKEIGSFQILIPSIEEQDKIANIISSINTQIQKEKVYKSLIKGLKKGLMQKLLTGKIRVKI